MQSIPSIDLYRELEVDPSATSETIDAAWKSLLKRSHPDVASDPVANERVKRLNLAHEWLADPGRRQLYDRSRRQPRVIAVPPPPRPAAAAASPPPRPTSPPSGSWGGTAAATPPPAAPPPPGSYREFAGAGAAPVPGSATAALASIRSSAALRRMPSYLVPVALVSVLIIVAASSYFASQRASPGASNAVAQVGSASPSARPSSVVSGATGSGAVGSGVVGLDAVGSGGIDPRTLPPPNVDADLPASCRGLDATKQFRYSSTTGDTPAQIVVVRCDALRSFGPLVYTAGKTGWQLAGKGTFENGFASQAFSGPISGKGKNEFGVAWSFGDGTTSHVVLYRVDGGLEVLWNSADAGLDWDLATYAYQALPSATPAGYLVITSADMKTGTCATCHDHALYREFYAWAVGPGGEPGLVRTSRQPFGVGP